MLTYILERDKSKEKQQKEHIPLGWIKLFWIYLYGNPVSSNEFINSLMKTVKSLDAGKAIQQDLIWKERHIPLTLSKAHSFIQNTTEYLQYISPKIIYIIFSGKGSGIYVSFIMKKK